MENTGRFFINWNAFFLVGNLYIYLYIWITDETIYCLFQSNLLDDVEDEYVDIA